MDLRNRRTSNIKRILDSQRNGWRYWWGNGSKATASHLLSQMFLVNDKHSVAIYGNASPELLEKLKARGLDTKFYSLLQGL
jgi:hypothetical protein